MDTIRTPEQINQDRRRFVGTAAITIAAAQFALTGSAQAEPGKAKAAELPKVKPGAHTSFGALKQIDAGLLNVGYAEAGPADGPAVILLHGWPYDIYSFVDVAPLLASAGHRVIIPYLRGYGTTRFLSGDTVRNGQQSVVAVDIIALMDALKIEKATLAGFDWGARTAYIIAALWPERCKALVSVSGYLIGSQEAGKMPLPPKAELQWWYQYYFATERGRAGYDKYRHDFSKLIWQLASPKWDFDDATFDRTAKSFDNPDHVAIVVHNYRWRLGLAEGEPKYDDLEKQLGHGSCHHGAHHHHGRRCQRRAPSGPQRLCEKVLGPLCAPDHQGRHRTQPSAGSPAGLCRSHCRGCRDLIEPWVAGVRRATRFQGEVEHANVFSAVAGVGGARACHIAHRCGIRTGLAERKLREIHHAYAIDGLFGDSAGGDRVGRDAAGESRVGAERTAGSGHTSSKPSGDDLAGKLARREIQRSPSSIPGREIVQVETLIPAGVEFGMAHSSGRRGRLHHRRSGHDDGARSCRRRAACRRWFPHSPADAPQCTRPRPGDRTNAVDLYRRGQPAACDLRGRTRREVGGAELRRRRFVSGFEKNTTRAARFATPSTTCRREP